MNYIKEIFENAQQEARKYAFEKQGNNVMIYPCGFAWVELKCRKNNKLGKELERQGIMEWDFYKKQYYFWVGEYNQSMYHKEAHASKLADILSNELFANFTYDSRMD